MQPYEIRFLRRTHSDLMNLLDVAIELQAERLKRLIFERIMGTLQLEPANQEAMDCQSMLEEDDENARKRRRYIPGVLD